MDCTTLCNDMQLDIESVWLSTSSCGKKLCVPKLNFCVWVSVNDPASQTPTFSSVLTLSHFISSVIYCIYMSEYMWSCLSLQVESSFSYLEIYAITIDSIEQVRDLLL